MRALSTFYLPKMRRIFFFTICCVIALLGCRNQYQKSNNDIPFTDIITEVNNFTTIGDITINLKNITDSSSTFLYSYSWKDRAAYTGDLSAIHDKVDLSFLNGEIEFSQGTDLLFNSRKEAILLSGDERKLALIHLASEKYEIFSYDTLIDPNIVLLSYWNSSMVFAKKLYLPIAYSDIFITNTESIRDYFARKTGVSFSLDESISNIELFGGFPLSYQKGLFYNDFYSKLTKFPNDNIACSYSCDDSIYLYNQSQNEKKAYFLGKKSKDVFMPYALNELRNGNYKRRYIIEEPRYLQLIFDPFTNLVYRVYKHKSDYLVDGKVIENRDIPWTLLVSDLDFTRITEYEFPDGDYTPIGMIPTADGLFIQKYEQENEKEIRGSLFQIPSH